MAYINIEGTRMEKVKMNDRDIYKCGYDKAIKDYEMKLLYAAENGTPIEIGGRAYFIKSDIQNLRDIFNTLEIDKKNI